MEVRKLTQKDDFTAVGSVFLRSFRTAYKGLLAPDYLQHLTPETWVPRLQQKPEENWVVIEDHHYVGVASLTMRSGTSLRTAGELRALYVDPAYFRQGYGTVLMMAALADLRAQKYAEVYLWALADNLQARKFYEHCHFTHDKDKMTKIGDQVVTLVRYRKTL
ncbi:GNAT family N-acetyltransferase [Pediococcus siamensis]|uniref:GNAT family N-acetyltransferase n=1 Tax=Pediococcus siamensis TaxID=381829 RepID=UPI0039A17860